ncbi:cation diffusion facilitator family transporter [Robiginitomaculum antarcticum]|uniref:cation diffusion facilitator family transporter n=1 Tax=Robiginitomaculum antarcticum TaxID=437507 RepID=UPI00037664F8|nr:cation diffusion facilitator family transporter [Robiginitomaculum antarcticum]
MTSNSKDETVSKVEMPGHDCADPSLHDPSAAGRAPVAAQIGVLGGLSAPGRLDPQEAARITRRITSYSVAVGVILSVMKFFIWEQSGSVGVLSSLVHSGLDLAAALATFFGVRYAARAPDATHSYGRGKAEGFVAVLQACLVLFSAGHIGEEAVHRIMDPQIVEHGLSVIVVMGFAIAMTFWLLMAQGHAIAATGSVAIAGDRAHYLSDMAASIAVVIGVALAAFTPFARADGIIALLIALWLVYTAFKVGRLAFNQLMDQELPPSERHFISELAGQDSRITQIKDLRTRASGPHVHIQMHAELSSDLSLLDAHDIICAAEARILAAFPAADVTIHPDPAGHDHGNSRFRRHEDTT